MTWRMEEKGKIDVLNWARENLNNLKSPEVLDELINICKVGELDEVEEGYLREHMKSIPSNLRKLDRENVSMVIEEERFLVWDRIKQVVMGPDFNPLLRIFVKSLDFSFVDIRNFEGDGMMENIELMEFMGCKKLRTLKGIERFANLKSLKIRNCNSLKDISGLKELSDLETLSIRDCRKINRFPVDGLESLQFLELSGLGLNDLSGVNFGLNATDVVLDYDHCLGSFNGIERFKNLRRLSAGFTPTLNDLSAIRGIGKLDKLKLIDTKGLHELNGLEGVEIGVLDLNCSNGLMCEEGLNGLSGSVIGELNLRGCHNLRSIEGVGRILGLKKLNLKACHRIRSIGEIADCSDLEELDMSYCLLLDDLTGIGNLTNLKRLNLSSNRSLRSVDVLLVLENLEKLDLRGLPKGVLSHDLKKRFVEKLGEGFLG